MATKDQSRFAYTAEQVIRVERSLSAERLAPYLARAQGDKIAALRLYEWNTALSGSLYCVLQGLEVTVRNAMHRTLTAGFGQDNWYDRVALQFPQAKDGDKAKRRLLGEKKQLDAGRIVAELAFGFWVGLIGPGYADALWIPHLYKAFPNRALERKDAHWRLDRIRKLRNRVAHHEPILQRDLRRDFHQIIETIEWICADTAAWVQSTSTFLELLDQQPR